MDDKIRCDYRFFGNLVLNTVLCIISHRISYNNVVVTGNIEPQTIPIIILKRIVSKYRVIYFNDFNSTRFPALFEMLLIVIRSSILLEQQAVRTCSIEAKNSIIDGSITTNDCIRSENAQALRGTPGKRVVFKREK